MGDILSKPDPAEFDLAIKSLLAVAGRKPDFSNTEDYRWIWRGKDEILMVDHWWPTRHWSRRGWTVIVNDDPGRSTDTYWVRRRAGPELADVLRYLQRDDVRKRFWLDDERDR